MAAADLTATRLRELLHYSPETGEFTRLKCRTNSHLVGKKAGHVNKENGYVAITVDGKKFRAHRLAWLYVHGVWSAVQIDHVDTDRSNNRFLNLREATRAENNQNLRVANKNNKCGFLGVSWNSKTKKWQASIRVNNRQHYLGRFSTPEEASAAYIAAKRQLHPFGQL